MRGATTVESTRVVLRSRQSMLAILARASMMQRCVKWGRRQAAGIQRRYACLTSLDAGSNPVVRRPPSIVVVVVCPPSTFQTQGGRSSRSTIIEQSTRYAENRLAGGTYERPLCSMFYVLRRVLLSPLVGAQTGRRGRAQCRQAHVLRFCAPAQRSGEGRPHGPRTVRDTPRTWAHSGPACSPGAPEGRTWRRWRGGGASPVERGRI